MKPPNPKQPVCQYGKLNPSSRVIMSVISDGRSPDGSSVVFDGLSTAHNSVKFLVSGQVDDANGAQSPADSPSTAPGGNLRIT